ncbi:MAG: VanZ family protein [Gammaproteobacteria bacterium]|nr:MAG: VanZ family protein [Gammaproteobacteria bacterium]
MPYSLIMVFVFNIKKESIVILTALLLSVLIETLQFILELGVADIDDVLLNISGAFIGWAIAKQIIRKEKGKVSVLNFL